MPLSIRNAEIDNLVEELKRLHNNATKTEIVGTALQKYLDSVRGKVLFFEKIKALQERAAAMGFVSDPSFDMKAFSDELYDYV